MQELKELLSLETKFRVKHRLFAKVSFVMANHGISGNDKGNQTRSPLRPKIRIFDQEGLRDVESKNILSKS